jgi:hypothetical protein
MLAREARVGKAPPAPRLAARAKTVSRKQALETGAQIRRLGHPTLTQQHHLDALALRRRYLPAQRSFQPPHLGFAAFDHPLSPNQMAQANHTSGEEKAPDYRSRIPIQAVMEAVLGR